MTTTQDIETPSLPPPLSTKASSLSPAAAIPLATDERALTRSLNAIRFAVFADSVTAFILDPNYAFMAFPGSHPDSFESTAPFGFNGATYFLAMTALLGSAIGSTFIGHISDRVGRKPCIVACLAIGALGAIGNYLARKSFWGFCISNFCQGLFAASVPVAMAYVSDVRTTRKEKDDEIGVLVALSMLGITGGGVAAIWMEGQGLFAPLLLGAAFNVAAMLAAIYYVIEPRNLLSTQEGSSSSSSVDHDTSKEVQAPKTIHKPLLINIIAGALADNIGSAGLLPIAMSPLAFTRFYSDFVAQGQDPIMSQSAFKWISVMVALTVIPGAGLSQVVFDKIGAAGGCVAGNLMTGLVTIACLLIATMEPASTGSFAGFIATLYVGFPFTVISQLSTGPMLDAMAPKHQRGMIQGLNVSAMNFATAVSPYLLGELADRVSVEATMWTCIAISFGAALINLPLMFHKVLQRPEPKAHKSLQALKGEDEELVQLLLNGEWVPAQDLDDLNERRMELGEPLLTATYKPYQQDKQHLKTMQKQARTDFVFLRDRMLEHIYGHEFQDEQVRALWVQQFEQSRPTRDQQQELARGLSQWFVEYLVDAGYYLEDSPILYKQMIMAAFPPIFDDQEEEENKKLTKDNIKRVAVNYTRVLNKYLDDQDLTGAKKAFLANRYDITSIDC